MEKIQKLNKFMGLFGLITLVIVGYVLVYKPYKESQITAE